MAYKMFFGSVKGNDYGAFFIIKNDKIINKNLKRDIWIHDNANIHRAKILKDLYSHINISYNEPYSPFMNPI